MEDFFVVSNYSPSLKTSLDDFLDAIQTEQVKKDVGKHYQYSELLDSFSDKSALLRSDDPTSFRSSVWLSKAFKKAYKAFFEAPLEQFTPQSFAKDDIRDIAKLSSKSLNLNHVKIELRKKGILLFLEHHIQGNKIDGAVFKLENGTPCVALSNRFNRPDFAWFTLLHELSHVALHYDYIDTPIVDNIKSLEHNIRESQADSCAKRSIASRNFWRTCTARSSIKNENLIREANEIEVAPQLLAGLIRFDKNDFSLYSDIFSEDKEIINVFEGL